jgi:hypothetical protein
MDLNTVKAESDLKPALRHRWIGNHAALRLILNPNKAIAERIELKLAGRDLRSQGLKPQTWWWDPRTMAVNQSNNQQRTTIAAAGSKRGMDTTRSHLDTAEQGCSPWKWSWYRSSSERRQSIGADLAATPRTKKHQPKAQHPFTTQTTSDSAVSERERLVRSPQQQPEWRPPRPNRWFFTR